MYMASDGLTLAEEAQPADAVPRLGRGAPPAGRPMCVAHRALVCSRLALPCVRSASASALLSAPALLPARMAAAATNPAPEPAAKKRKLLGREFYESIGSPRTVVAPMVDQSELVCLLPGFVAGALPLTLP